MFIQIEGLHHVYMEGTPFATRVLFDINLEVKEKEFLGITGPTRGGKSTLIQYFNGLFLPKKEGQVRVLGQDMANRSISLKKIRHEVGLVFQSPEHQIFQETVGEDIGFWPKNLGWPKEQIEEGVKGVMDLVGLDYKTFYHRDVFSLSGGEKRRVAIAGVLIARPKILVLDDPISGLDPKGRQQILRLINELHKTGIVIIFVTSAYEDILPFVHRLVVLKEGRILFQGSKEEAFLHKNWKKYKELGLPLSLQLKEVLKKKGFLMKKTPLTMEELEEELDELLKGERTWNS